MQNIEQIQNIIESIIDPDLGVSLKKINAISTINMNDHTIDLKLNLPGPVTYLKKEYERIIGIKLQDASINKNIELEIFENSDSIKNREGKASKIKHIIAVASGKGGVGKSTISTNIATELAAQGAKVGMIDSDIYGPSQPIMFGLSGETMEAFTDQHGKTTAYPVEKYGVKIASIGFVLNRDEAASLRGPMLSRVFSLFYEQIEWGELDYLVFDLPPGTGDVHLSFIQKTAPDGVVLITTPQEISLADVRRGAMLFQNMTVNILGVIENMSYFIPPDNTDKKYYIFGQGGGKNIATELGLTLLGEIPISIDMRETSDAGKPIVLQEWKPNFQKEILKDTTANIISQLRRQKYV